uniref:Uncharacterized protein n=1 Tax=Alexandrium monilatum TaxID=311494 RepID=A0A7S4PSV2_9DINO|mmetsp:Transcript_30070/g.94842  ORF Transcript_30070/g.94842 Transcript_30070/m.94842 type:complete len:402 (-) Transcript_30070:101-1306(-)
MQGASPLHLVAAPAAVAAVRPRTTLPMAAQPAAAPPDAPRRPGGAAGGLPGSAAEWSSLASSGLGPGVQLAHAGAGSAAPSELSTSAGGTARPPQGGFERRVAWLEEDVAVLHRRLRGECGEGTGAAAGGGGGSGLPGGDEGLRALVSLLDGELAVERQAREALEARIGRLEDAITHERRDRETQLRSFSAELEATMRGLIGRIDDGISAGAASMRERTDQTELRLRTLIKRVDEGLSAGAAALQDTLSHALGSGAGEREEAAPAGEPAGGGAAGVGAWLPEAAAAGVQGVARAPEPASDPAAPTELVQSWEQLRQENVRLRERRAQLYGARSPVGGRTPLPMTWPTQCATPAATPSLAYPCTLQVPGSGLNAAPGVSGPRAGTAATGFPHTEARAPHSLA